MGWQRCKNFGICDEPPAQSNVVVAQQPFSTDFDVAARDGQLWVRYAGRVCDSALAKSCHATAKGEWLELILKGVSWSGVRFFALRSAVPITVTSWVHAPL